jgi:hypothetical protein
MTVPKVLDDVASKVLNERGCYFFRTNEEWNKKEIH